MKPRIARKTANDLVRGRLFLMAKAGEAIRTPGMHGGNVLSSTRNHGSEWMHACDRIGDRSCRRSLMREEKWELENGRHRHILQSPSLTDHSSARSFSSLRYSTRCSRTPRPIPHRSRTGRLHTRRCNRRRPNTPACHWPRRSPRPAGRRSRLHHSPPRTR
jgi:hypothetical protein